MNLTVSAFDSRMVEFDNDQYKLMDFNIEIERTGVVRDNLGLKIYPTQDNRRFIAECREPGIYQLTAYSYKYRDIS